MLNAMGIAKLAGQLLQKFPDAPVAIKHRKDPNGDEVLEEAHFETITMSHILDGKEAQATIGDLFGTEKATMSAIKVRATNLQDNYLVANRSEEVIKITTKFTDWSSLQVSNIS